MRNHQGWISRVTRISLSMLVAVVFSLTPGFIPDRVQALPPGPPVATFTVTAAGPLGDLPSGMGAYIIDGVCPSGPFAFIGCTLREAVDEANAIGAGLVPPSYVDVIVPPGAPIELYYGSIVVQSNVVVIGAPGAEPIIHVSPAWMTPPFPFPAVPPPYDIFQMTGNNSELFGMGIINWAGFNLGDGIEISGNQNTVDFSILLGNGNAGVRITGLTPANGTGNIVTGNLIGIDWTDNCYGNQKGVVVEAGAAGNQIDHNRISCNTSDGIQLDSAQAQVTTTVIDTNTIGLDSTDAVDKGNGQSGIFDNQSLSTQIINNIISGNSADGVHLTGAFYTSLNNNLIGTDGTGSTAIANGMNGVLIEDAGDDGGASNNITISAGNLISGNTIHGIKITGEYTDSINIMDNIIGLDSLGTLKIPNSYNGIYIYDGPSWVTIGGANPANSRNVISGNTWNGVEIEDASQITLDSNYIGLDLSGSSILSNTLDGVYVHGNSTSNVTIGSLPPYTTIPNQYISGNDDCGVVVDSASGTTIGPKTFIGVAGDGTSAKGNGEYGVLFTHVNGAGMYSQKVAYNGTSGTYAGVAVTGTSTNVSIRPYAVAAVSLMDIHGNSGLPIDLAADGHTANDTGDVDSGPNGLLNYPVITGFNATNVWGTVCNNCNVYLYFASGNPGANGSGGLYKTFTSASGTSWSTAIPSGCLTSDLSVVAMDASGNTSEMSPRHRLFVPLVISP